MSGSAYYAAAVAWASKNGVVEGYEDGSFRPDQPITREQLAAVLYRYAMSRGVDVTASGDLAAYADAGSVSSWRRMRCAGPPARACSPAPPTALSLRHRHPCPGRGHARAPLPTLSDDL